MMIVLENNRIPTGRTYIGQASGDLVVINPGPFFNMDQPPGVRKRNVQVRCLCGNEFFTREQNIIKGLSTRCMACKHQRHSRIMSLEGVGWNVWHNRYKQNARYRRLIFDLTVADVKYICSQRCFYCNDAPMKRNPIRSHIIFANGIDRVDSSVGYIVGNCVPCCSRCNQIKWDMSRDEFVLHVQKIYQHQLKWDK